VVNAAQSGPTNSKGLTIEQRADCLKAIERIYYDNRIWPKENKQPKPAFESVMKDEMFRQRAENVVQQSNALGYYWNRPLTESQLQAELNRMAQYTKSPKVLRQLFTALNNDPYLIAECIARPNLAERFLHEWYSHDERFHGALRKKIETELT